MFPIKIDPFRRDIPHFEIMRPMRIFRGIPNSQGPVGSKERGAQVDFGAGVGEQPVHLLDEPEAGDGWEIGQLSILWKYII